MSSRDDFFVEDSKSGVEQGDGQGHVDSSAGVPAGDVPRRQPVGPHSGFGGGRGPQNVVSQGAGHVSSGSQDSAGSGNLGFARRSAARRVVGVGSSLVSVPVSGLRPVTRSYGISPSLQFNQTEEFQADSISRDFAQEVIEKLFIGAWALDSSNVDVMRKAEDVLFSFLVVRGASPYASFDLSVLIGGVEVNLESLSDILRSHEIQRRRFVRAVADDLRSFIKLPENVVLRDRIISKLGINSHYVHLGFDGSTHCTNMNRNEVAFTKALESRNLFDDESVKGSLTNSSLIDGVFNTSVNRGKSGV